MCVCKCICELVHESAYSDSSSYSSFNSQVVKEIAGEEGMTLCRSLLDGIEDDGDNDLQGRVTEGRCTGNTHGHVNYLLYK